MRARRASRRARSSSIRALASGKRPNTISRCLRALDRAGRARLSDAARHVAQIDDRRLTGRDVDARAFGTAATVALAAAAGIDIVRVHDVAEQRDVVRVADAIVRGWRPAGWSDGLPMTAIASTMRGIRAFGHHGANPGEKDVAQPFDIDVSLDVDLHGARAQRHAGRYDRLRARCTRRSCDIVRERSVRVTRTPRRRRCSMRFFSMRAS